MTKLPTVWQSYNGRLTAIVASTFNPSTQTTDKKKVVQSGTARPMPSRSSQNLRLIYTIRIEVRVSALEQTCAPTINRNIIRMCGADGCDMYVCTTQEKCNFHAATLAFVSSADFNKIGRVLIYFLDLFGGIYDSCSSWTTTPTHTM